MFEWVKAVVGPADLEVLKWFGSLAGGAIGAYLVVRSKNLATRADAEGIRDELRKNTLATKSIEQQFSRSDFFMKAELEYRERQLEFLYGPVYGYLKSQNAIYNLWVANQLTDRNFLIKQLLKQQNEAVRSILIKNVHLIDDNEMKDYFSIFFTSTIIFDLYAASADEGEVPNHLANNPLVKYPEAFQVHIFETTEKLKARVQALNQEFAYPLDSELPNRAVDRPPAGV